MTLVQYLLSLFTPAVVPTTDDILDITDPTGQTERVALQLRRPDMLSRHSSIAFGFHQFSRQRAQTKVGRNLCG